MSNLLPILAIVVVLGIVATIIKTLAQKGKAPADYPYTKEQLFTPAERSFLGVLDQAVGAEFRIMGKVRLADVIRVRPGTDRTAWQKAFNRIQSKHLDFVACDPTDHSVQFAVELDDKSHDRADRQARDAFLDAAIEKAGIPLIRFAAQRSYVIDDVRNAIAARLNPAATEEVQPESSPVAAPAITADESPSCPTCGAGMLRRKASRGQNAGQEFWGCSNYPKCRGIVAITG
jgi:very-short-patch-repair endonuclease